MGAKLLFINMWLYWNSCSWKMYIHFFT